MVDQALPLWADRGLDRQYGGFLENLTFDAAPGPAVIKRTRTIARQIYVFSHAFHLGWAPGAAVAAEGLAFLEQRCRTTSGGWARVVSREGVVIDETPDLYDYAFVLFALAWFYRSSAEAHARVLADRTIAEIETRFATAEGFWHCLPPNGPRQQNPHMHLLEACLAAAHAFANERYLAHASALVQLMKGRLFNGAFIGEAFDVAWIALPGQAFEPGHQFEWVWLLNAYTSQGGGAEPEIMRALLAAGERGVSERNLVYDALDPTDVLSKRTSRTWPNTERLRAYLAMLDRFNQRSPLIEQCVDTLFEFYLSGPEKGLWVDQIDAEGRPLPGPVPASTFYHLFGAFADALRLQDKF